VELLDEHVCGLYTPVPLHGIGDSRALVDPSGGVGDPASYSMPRLAKCAKFGIA